MGRMKELSIQIDNEIVTDAEQGFCPACEIVILMALTDGYDPNQEELSITCKVCGRDDADIPT